MKAKAVLIFIFIFLVFALYASKKEKDAFDINKVKKELSNVNYSGFDTSNNIAEQNGSIPEDKPLSAFVIILRIFLYLLIIVALFVLMIWILKKSGLGKEKSLSGNGEVLDIITIGNNKTIVVTRVYDFVYIIGYSSGNLTLIDKFEGEKALEIIAQSGGNDNITGFKKVLDNFMQKFIPENGEQ